MYIVDMHFVVDHDNKIIFGWSAKCGCSHVKYIYWFLKTGTKYEKIGISEKSLGVRFPSYFIPTVHPGH